MGLLPSVLSGPSCQGMLFLELDVFVAKGLCVQEQCVCTTDLLYFLGEKTQLFYLFLSSVITFLKFVVYIMFSYMCATYNGEVKAINLQITSYTYNVMGFYYKFIV